MVEGHLVEGDGLAADVADALVSLPESSPVDFLGGQSALDGVSTHDLFDGTAYNPLGSGQREPVAVLTPSTADSAGPLRLQAAA